MYIYSIETNKIMKTSKDNNGNWKGIYGGMVFTLYNLTEGWSWSLIYDSPIMGKGQIHNSGSDFEPTKTKKDSLYNIQSEIERLTREHNEFNDLRKQPNTKTRL